MDRPMHIDWVTNIDLPRDNPIGYYSSCGRCGATCHSSMIVQHSRWHNWMEGGKKKLEFADYLDRRDRGDEYL